MKLAETILNNEKNRKAAENKQLIRARLKDVVYANPQQISQLLQTVGISNAANLPSPVLLAIVTKHLAKNSGLREAVAKMILGADGYASADGALWQTIGGALSAVGSVLGGIGRSQSQTAAATSDQQKQIDDLNAKLINEQDKGSRQKWIWIGVAAVAVIASIVAVVIILKKSAVPPKPGLAHSGPLTQKM